MTILVPDVPAYVSFIATSGQATFLFNFKFYSASDILVWKNAVQLATTAYTVAGAGADTGQSVTLLSPAALNDIIEISRQVPYSRSANFPLTGPFRTEALNVEQAKQVMMIQQLRDRDVIQDANIADNTTDIADLTTRMVAVETGKVSKSGDRMTGPLFITLDPAHVYAFDEFVPRTYVDGIATTLTDLVNNHTHSAAQITDFDEALDDRVATLLTAGANVTLTYNDTTNRLQISSTGGLSAQPPAISDPVSNGDLVIEATNNLYLTFKYKGTDGVVRIFNMPLAEPATVGALMVDFGVVQNTMYLPVLEDF